MLRNEYKQSKQFRKTNISYPLIQIRKCAYQGVRNVSFSENFAYTLNESVHITITGSHFYYIWATPIFSQNSQNFKKSNFQEQIS